MRPATLPAPKATGTLMGPYSCAVRLALACPVAGMFYGCASQPKAPPPAPIPLNRAIRIVNGNVAQIGGISRSQYFGGEVGFAGHFQTLFVEVFRVTVAANQYGHFHVVQGADVAYQQAADGTCADHAYTFNLLHVMISYSVKNVRLRLRLQRAVNKQPCLATKATMMTEVWAA